MTRNRVVQPILGLVASAPRELSPSQRELVRRAGTYLSIQQRAARRRSEAVKATARADDAPITRDVSALMPRLGFGRKVPP